MLCLLHVNTKPKAGLSSHCPTRPPCRLVAAAREVLTAPTARETVTVGLPQAQPAGSAAQRSLFEDRGRRQQKQQQQPAAANGLEGASAVSARPGSRVRRSSACAACSPPPHRCCSCWMLAPGPAQKRSSIAFCEAGAASVLQQTAHMWLSVCVHVVAVVKWVQETRTIRSGGSGLCACMPMPQQNSPVACVCMCRAGDTVVLATSQYTVSQAAEQVAGLMRSALTEACSSGGALPAPLSLDCHLLLALVASRTASNACAPGGACAHAGRGVQEVETLCCTARSNALEGQEHVHSCRHSKHASATDTPPSLPPPLLQATQRSRSACALWWWTWRAWWPRCLRPLLRLLSCCCRSLPRCATTTATTYIRWAAAARSLLRCAMPTCDSSCSIWVAGRAGAAVQAGRNAGLGKRNAVSTKAGCRSHTSDHLFLPCRACLAAGCSVRHHSPPTCCWALSEHSSVSCCLKKSKAFAAAGPDGAAAPVLAAAAAAGAPGGVVCSARSACAQGGQAASGAVRCGGDVALGQCELCAALACGLAAEIHRVGGCAPRCLLGRSSRWGSEREQAQLPRVWKRRLRPPTRPTTPHTPSACVPIHTHTTTTATTTRPLGAQAGDDCLEAMLLRQEEELMSLVDGFEGFGSLDGPGTIRCVCVGGGGGWWL